MSFRSPNSILRLLALNEVGITQTEARQDFNLLNKIWKPHYYRSTKLCILQHQNRHRRLYVNHTFLDILFEQLPGLYI